MRSLRPWLIVALLVSVTSLLLTGLGAHAGTPFKAKSLVNASMGDIQQAALEYTYGRFGVQGAAPVILLTRTVTKSELPSLGLSAIDFAGEDPPLVLVALKGDFVVSNIRHSFTSSTPTRATYIVYVFDLKAGAPTLIQYSADGSDFRRLLNDPKLPQGPSNEQAPVAPKNANATQLPYGSIAPAAIPPNEVLPTEQP